MIQMPHRLKIAFSLLIVALIVGVPTWHGFARSKRYRNFRVVEEGVLYRSGLMTPEGLKRSVEQKRIKTVVSLRDGLSKAEQAEEKYCQERGIRFVRIPFRAWQAADGSVPQEEGFKDFFQVMREPANHPVLIHCFAGHHRTGGFCAAYRMEFHHWTQQEAIHEMRQLGYDNVFQENDIFGYLSAYHTRRTTRGW